MSVSPPQPHIHPPPHHQHPHYPQQQQPTIAQLQFELSEAGKLYTAAQNQLTQLKQAYNTLNTQHHTTTTKHIPQLNNTITTLQHTITQLESDHTTHYTAYTATLAEKEEEITQLLATHVPADTLDVLRVKVREEAREAVREKTAAVVEELTAVRERLAAVEKDKAVLTVQHAHTVSVLNSSIDRMKADSEAKSDEWKRRTLGWQEKEEERRSERARVEAVERENVEWGIRWKRCVEESDERRKEEEKRDDAHRRERVEWEREKSELLSARAVSGQQLAMTKRQCEEHEREREQTRRSVNEWKDRVGVMEEEVREMREEGKRREGEVSGLREMYERRVREKEAAEEERDRQHRLTVDELYGQVKSERESKEALRRQLLDKQEELLAAAKRHTELQANSNTPHTTATTTTASTATTATATATAVTQQLQAELASCRANLTNAHNRIRTMDEQHARLTLRYEQSHTQWTAQQRQHSELATELSSLQARYREAKERDCGWRDRVEELSVMVGVLERERDEVRRERDEERRWMADGREQQMRGWRQEKAVLLHRLAAGDSDSGSGSGSGGSGVKGGGGGEGKYKVMCGVMKERLEGMLREYEKERVEWETRAAKQQLAMEEMERRLSDSDKFQQQLHRNMQTPTKLSF